MSREPRRWARLTPAPADLQAVRAAGLGDCVWRMTPGRTGFVCRCLAHNHLLLSLGNMREYGDVTEVLDDEAAAR
jgi:hypothetical protein